jgi:ABC-type Fe3+-citrate transport system substrate-binding protein
MFEMSPPLGFKDDNSSYQYDFSSTIISQFVDQSKSSKAHLINHKKKMILYKKDIFIKLKNFQVPIYANNFVHFKDVSI